MGVDIYFRTVYGVKIEWNDDLSEAYDEVYDDEDTPYIELESMSGTYMILGENLFRSDNFRWIDGDGDSFKSIDPNSLSYIEQEYKEKFINKFPQFEHLIHAPFLIHVFVEYS